MTIILSNFYLSPNEENIALDKVAVGLFSARWHLNSFDFKAVQSVNIAPSYVSYLVQQTFLYKVVSTSPLRLK